MLHVCILLFSPERQQWLWSCSPVCLDILDIRTSIYIYIHFWTPSEYQFYNSACIQHLPLTFTTEMLHFRVVPLKPFDSIFGFWNHFGFQIMVEQILFLCNSYQPLIHLCTIDSVMTYDISVPFKMSCTELMPEVPGCVLPPHSLDPSSALAWRILHNDQFPHSLNNLFIASKGSKHHFEQGILHCNKYAVV